MKSLDRQAKKITSFENGGETVFKVATKYYLLKMLTFRKKRKKKRKREKERKGQVKKQLKCFTKEGLAVNGAKLRREGSRTC